MSYHKKDDEHDRNPFTHLEKTTVLQEARSFNEMPINARKCIIILTKILCLVHQGETFGTREATETFFSMTKLFQHKNVALRRMVYLCIKAMSTISEDVIMVTSSLMKDMNSKDDIYRGPAIRALCTVADGTTLQSLERFLKQAIVDRNVSVSSSALVSSLHLLSKGQDVVRRWVNEVQQAANNSTGMAQYHALGLLYHIKQRDRLAVQKLVATQMRNPALSSPFAYCLLIRYASKVLDQDPDGSVNEDIFAFLERCLRHKNEMVVYEAARAIVSVKNVTSRQIAPAVAVLQVFLGSPRPVLRFAAVRTLNKVSITHPNALKSCVLDMETLITDSNRSVATLAITTLLKTGTESSVDRLMKQISSFMHEITDEFKIVVVEAIRALCLKFPQKYPVLMNFLSSTLRDEGGFEYKRAIVKTITSIVENVKEAKETGLAQLCEYIEDCEYPALLTSILDMLGTQGPTTSHPHKYIRFIYNRLILENSVVRAAAVDALTKFGQHCEGVRQSVVIILRRCMLDSDDEVRDRVMFALSILEGGPAADITHMMLTESETEYVVKCTKHAFAEHIVFEYSVTNTLNDQILENAQVVMEGGEQEIDADDVIMIPAPKIEYDQTVSSFVAFPSDPTVGAQTFETRLDFLVRDVDPDTQEVAEDSYEDTYALEDVDLEFADFMQAVSKPNFSSAWSAMQGVAEEADTFNLEAIKSLQDAARNIPSFLGMATCEKSNVVPEDATRHTLFLSGVFVGNIPVLAVAKLAFDQGVSMELAVRSENEDLCTLILQSVA
ncbi:coatomer protein complex [Salpingoeca rosetta]|uniref:Coatomer subunit gamma n=1 Tax=Salpingoeca rosetta (strain ATCC 50818 / BSB-021) TaxID=946362 RepID=F2US27_SALR5|nr:coatomer protein complex [Salpingoeca rosetta]EGD80432.1 coatomer protein complex [Salpingoeca rosetta]|eukprot:XP_004987996.1 coatomer protein complex [Salpingoeca rosetta]